MADDKPIIIVKKKGGHGGHHGGAWKVAYADFVTAMMAFFMVMWLVNSASHATKQSISSYFRKPGLFNTGSGTPLLIGEAGILEDAYVPPRPEEKAYKSGTDQSPRDQRSGSKKDEIKRQIKDKSEKAKGIMKGKADTQGVKVENQKKSSTEIKPPGGKSDLEKIAEQIKAQIEASPDLKKLLGLVDVRLDADGLNIEIMDTDQSSMFASGSARILPEAALAFEKITEILQKVPHSIDIVGHTDAKPFSARSDGYSNWELSADRANAARRLLEGSGIARTRITNVVGRADKDLRNKEDPFAASNRRITLKMKFNINQRVDLSKDPNALSPESIDRLTAAPTVAPIVPTPPLDPAAELPQGAAAQDEPQVEVTPAGERPRTADSTLFTTIPVAKGDDKAHGFVPKNIIQASDKKNTISLPDEELPPETAAADAPQAPSPPKDKIFKHNPVLGPPDPFAD